MDLTRNESCKNPGPKIHKPPTWKKVGDKYKARLNPGNCNINNSFGLLASNTHNKFGRTHLTHLLIVFTTCLPTLIVIQNIARIANAVSDTLYSRVRLWFSIVFGNALW